LINERRAFGDRLRRQRERQLVTLSQLAESTKVAASLFAGLERGDCSRWPGGVYNRAFVRAYATAVQLDPDEVVAEFVEYYETPAEPSARKPAKAADDASVRPVMRLGLAVDPTENWSRALRTVVLTAADVLAIAVIAAAAVVSTGMPVWNALALAGIGYHVITRMIGAMPRIDRRWLRGASEAGVESDQTGEEVPVSNTASTIA
jgi:transcriptional regulator with XRE-family HTH domain